MNHIPIYAIWGNSYTFPPGKIYWKKYSEKINTVLTRSIEKNFLIDPLTTNNAIYRDSLVLNFEKFPVYFVSITAGIYLLNVANNNTKNGMKFVQR